MYDPNSKPIASIQTEENVLFGVIGAFLFALLGGALYIGLSLIGFISWISGYVAVVCAIKGWAIFAKKESKRGIIISVILAAIVLIIAWYVGFCIEMVDAYKAYYAAGEVDFVPSLTMYIFSVQSFMDLTVNPLDFVYLALSLGLGAAGCWSYISSMIKRQKAMAAQEAAMTAAAVNASFGVSETVGGSETPEAPAEAALADETPSDSDHEL